LNKVLNILVGHLIKKMIQTLNIMNAVKTLYKEIYFLLTILILDACQPNPERNQLRSEEKLIEKSVLSTKPFKRDSIILNLDFDKKFKSETRIYFDKNNVKWEADEKNEFRFVYQVKLNLLIVYKNNIEFKTYKWLKIATVNNDGIS
jgi:hypothetical protein